MQRVIHQIIGPRPASDEREQMGRFLRHAFPLGLESFTEIGEFLDGSEEEESGQARAMFGSGRPSQH